MKLVFGVDNVKLVDEDGAPCGKKVLIIKQPLHVRRHYFGSLH